jgi:hypothetical protein
MKCTGLLVCCVVFQSASAQVLQFHYDGRKTIDPKHNNRNFCTLYFEYFKTQDSGKHFIKPGSFLLKMQSDFRDQKNNMGQFFMQVAQTFRCWQPKVFLNIEYKGGLGLTQPREYSYVIANTYSIGVSYPFRLGNAYMSTVLSYKYVSYSKGSRDWIFTVYCWKGMLNYKAELAGDFSLWTENRNRGDAFTANGKGKRFYLFAEPQFWYNLTPVLGLGTKVNTYYHVLIPENKLLVYPTLAVRCRI